MRPVEDEAHLVGEGQQGEAGLGLAWTCDESLCEDALVQRARSRSQQLGLKHIGQPVQIFSVGGGAPKKVASGVIDFDITQNCVVFSRDETVYAYVFADDKTYLISETGSNAQFVMAGGSYAIWRDMSDPAQTLWKYLRVVG